MLKVILFLALSVGVGFAQNPSLNPATTNVIFDIAKDGFVTTQTTLSVDADYFVYQLRISSPNIVQDSVPNPWVFPGNPQTIKFRIQNNDLRPGDYYYPIIFVGQVGSTTSVSFGINLKVIDSRITPPPPPPPTQTDPNFRPFILTTNINAAPGDLIEIYRLFPSGAVVNLPPNPPHGTRVTILNHASAFPAIINATGGNKFRRNGFDTMQLNINRQIVLYFDAVNPQAINAVANIGYWFGQEY